MALRLFEFQKQFLIVTSFIKVTQFEKSGAMSKFFKFNRKSENLLSLSKKETDHLKEKNAKKNYDLLKV